MHFFMKAVFAAPASFFSVAWPSHAALDGATASRVHLSRKLALAAPARFLAPAWA